MVSPSSNLCIQTERPPFFLHPSRPGEAIAITIMSTQDVNCEGIYLHGKNEEFMLAPVFSRALFDLLSSSARSLTLLDYRAPCGGLLRPKEYAC